MENLPRPGNLLILRREVKPEAMAAERSWRVKQFHFQAVWAGARLGRVPLAGGAVSILRRRDQKVSEG